MKDTQVDKLYVIVRGDIPPGLQIAQSCHVCFEFQKNHIELTKLWNEESNYIVILSCKDEEAINKLIHKAERKNIRFSIFREPDLDNQITAIALEPTKRSKRICSSLPLAMR